MRGNSAFERGMDECQGVKSQSNGWCVAWQNCTLGMFSDIAIELIRLLPRVLCALAHMQLPQCANCPFQIPLGTDGVWTYGGLTRPASSRTASTQTATTSATPSSSTSIVSSTSSSTSATPSSVSSSPTSSSSTSSSPTSSSPTSSSPTSSSPTSSSSQVQSTSTSTVYATSSSASVPSSSSSLNKGALIGIILGSILGTLLLLLLALLFLRWRRRRQDAGYQTPIWTGWEIVDPTPAESQDNGHTHDADRPLGEGSPRGSGEEADSFLRRSGTTEGGTTPMADTSTRLASVPPAAAAGARAGAGAAGSGSNSGTNNSGGSGAARTESTAVSDYGILLHGSDYTNDPEGFFTQGPARPSTDMSHSDNPRRIIPPSELLRIERERDEQEQLMRNIPSTSRAMATVPEHYSPLSPPPPLDPDRTSRASPPPKASSSAISAGSANEQDDPMVLTARRVRLSQLGPRSQPELRSESTRGSSSAGVWGSLGLGGLARLSRLSWFKNLKDNLEDPYTSPRSRHGSRPSSWVARPLSEHDIEVGRALLDDEFKLSRPVGVTDEGERPMSSVSAKSAVSGNTIYHDAESVAGTPPPLPTLPRAYMSSGPTGHTQSHGGTEPPLYESEQTTKDNDHAPRLVDVLDMPAPASVSQFSSASSRSVQFPPGLMMLPSQPSWYGNSSDAETSGITIDVLEDTPPRPGDGWRAIARNATLSHPDHRTSFGMVSIAISHCY